MIRLRKKVIFSTLAVIVITGALWFFAAPFTVHALDTGLNYATGTGLSAQDPRVAVAKIIRIIIGFLGVIALGLIIYAGFIWMTAKGEEEKIQQAKKIMISAVIGLAIILASFGITSFIISSLSGATGGGSSGSCSPACSQGQYCCNSSCQNTPCNTIGGGNNVFLVTGTTPAHQAVNVIRNAVIRFRFNSGVSNTSVSNSSFTVKISGADVDGQRVVNGNYIEFTPNAACDAPNETLKCFPKDALISVVATTDIKDVNNRSLTCGGTSRCLLDFTTGNIVDTEKPQINITSQQICTATNNNLQASSIDNYGVSKIDFYVANNLVGSSINPNPYPGVTFNALTQWTAVGNTGDEIVLKATAYDIDTNEASAEKTVRLSPAHCCNGVKDGDETGIDCGGSCLSCSGQACSSTPGQCANNLCQSDLCSGSGSLQGCVCQDRPKITWVSPAGGFCSNDVNKSCHVNTDCTTGGACDLGTPNGTVGNFVTIAGSGFGTTPGKVYFNNTEADLASDPTAGNPLCKNTAWQDGQVIAVVPLGVSDGIISVETSSGAKDTTKDAYGPLINDFKKNTIDRPGICALSPTKGKINDEVKYQGIKLINAKAYYGDLINPIDAINSSFTVSKEGTAEVPNINSGSTTTFVSKASIESNFLPFTKENEPYNGPIISSVEPLTGPVGQYVTIRGTGFGSSRSTSKVFFGPVTGGVEANYSFPDVCADSTWNDKQIVVKVPPGIATNLDYQITLQRSGFADANSNDQKFVAKSGTPDPGVCRLQPALGQANSEIMLWGEYFGSKDANSIVRFYNNRNQQGAAITFWDIDQSASGIKPWKVITTVPQAAATGPVRLLAGTTPQISNALNFIVGQCTKDADCGTEVGATCCAAGLPEAGKCKNTPTECYGSVATSVYQWRFSTGSLNQCAPDQPNRCGTVCCSGACDPVTPNKCLKCLPKQNECGDHKCCNQSCVGTPISHCPDPSSCSGYSYNQCLEGFYCPNKPGLCSPYPGTGNPIEVGDGCSDDVCLNKSGCKDSKGLNICHYDSVLNKCVQNNTNPCTKAVKDSNGDPITETARCDAYSNGFHWQITRANCPLGWRKISNNVCVDNTDINGPCTKCSNNFTCQMSGTDSKCAQADTICPTGSTCNILSGKCTKPDTGKCDCCCSKKNNNADCCFGLKCEGDCGADSTKFGLCSGCAPGGVPDDSLCNCLGSTGSYCDTNGAPGGVCRDCTDIKDPQACSDHEYCCVDGKNGNKCKGLDDGTRFQENGAGVFYCSYFNCNNTYPNSCKGFAEKTGVYNKLTTCQQSCITAPIMCGRGGNNEQCIDTYCPGALRCDTKTCECKTDDPGPGLPCKDQQGNCNGVCSIGYQCLLPAGYNGGGNAPIGNGNIGDGNGGGNGQDTCRCCCKPPVNPNDVDTCKSINNNLSCLPDKEPCTSPAKERGLCCGCSKDADCGDVATTGCSTVDRCCRTRPAVSGRVPAVNATNVCRNTAIEATFNQKMDTTSFNENVFLIGDYKGALCPSDFSPVASASSSTTGRFASIIFSIKQVIAKIFPSLIDKPAFADFGHLCYVKGNVVSYDIGSSQTKVSFSLGRALDIGINYYFILKGDPDLTNQNTKDYYNANINSIYKIGATGAVQPPAVNQFTPATIFSNAEIWSFTTGEDICKLDKVDIKPSFQLFQRSKQVGTTLQASALDKRNNPIQTLPGSYSWGWSWLSDNTDIATLAQGGLGQEFTAVPTSGNKQDAQTFARAKAKILVDTVNVPSTKDEVREGVATLRVFLCENPWPVYYSEPPFPSGYTWPWQDSTQKIEFYYCRDKAGVGTIDDLPSLSNPPIIPPGTGTRKICMFGANAGKTCSSDANCNNLAGSCLSEVLKEFFFFRETEPGIPNIAGTADPLGGKVNLTWSATVNASKYKVYYGVNPGQYIFTADVSAANGQVTKTISGLVNGLNYYFAVTALSDKNQESIYSNQLKLMPADTTPPAIPALRAGGGGGVNNGKIYLSWKKITDADHYIAYIGTAPGDYSLAIPVSTTSYTFTSIGGGGLNDNTDYYVAVKAVDGALEPNTSGYSNEVKKKPSEPYLISLRDQGVQGGNKANVVWLPFPNALGYNIYYHLPLGATEKITVGSNVTSKLTPALANGTYSFIIKAIRQTSPEIESSASNELSIVIDNGNGGQ